VIAVAWGSLCDEVLRFVYALEAANGRTVAVLVIEFVLLALGIGAWRRGRRQRTRRPAEASRVLRPVASALLAPPGAQPVSSRLGSPRP
jgi:hypothetical protein